MTTNAAAAAAVPLVAAPVAPALVGVFASAVACVGIYFVLSSRF